MIHGFRDYIQLFFNSSCFISSRISINAKWLIVILLVAFCLMSSSNDHLQSWPVHMSAMYQQNTPGTGCWRWPRFRSGFGETKPQSFPWFALSIPDKSCSWAARATFLHSRIPLCHGEILLIPLSWPLIFHLLLHNAFRKLFGVAFPTLLWVFCVFISILTLLNPRSPQAKGSLWPASSACGRWGWCCCPFWA